MSKNLKTKLLIGIILCIAFSMLAINSSVKATTENNTDTEEKIMKYDAKTGEITEVDEEELIQVMNSSRSTNGGMELDAYIPENLANTSESVFSSSEVSPIGYRVTNTLQYPYQMTCRVSMKGINKEGNYRDFITSASIVGPNIALTCAHGIFNEIDDYNVFDEWECFPAYDYQEVKVEGMTLKATYTQVYFSNDYLAGDDTKDWAVCVLDKPLGQYVGYYGVRDYGTNEELNNMNVTITGYPKDASFGFDGHTQWKVSGSTYDVDKETFKVNVLAFAGYSGSPVWRDEDYRIVGIMDWTGKNETFAKAYRTNSKIITLIQNLRDKWQEQNS